MADNTKIEMVGGSEDTGVSPADGGEPVKEALLHELDQAERKAWDSLARYKFQMFGYWAAIWVHLNRISGAKRPNPWKNLVHLARKEVATTVHRYQPTEGIRQEAAGRAFVNGKLNDR